MDDNDQSPLCRGFEELENSLTMENPQVTIAREIAAEIQICVRFNAGGEVSFIMRGDKVSYLLQLSYNQRNFDNLLQKVFQQLCKSTGVQYDLQQLPVFDYQGKRIFFHVVYNIHGISHSFLLKFISDGRDIRY
jgi:hypothetical protein